MDLFGFACSGVALLWTVAVELRLQATFGKMFTDFGGELPALTLLCLRPWFPLVLGLLPLGLVLDGLLRQVAPPGRVVRAVSAAVLAVLAPVLFLVGVYLPIFSLAGAIR